MVDQSLLENAFFLAAGSALTMLVQTVLRRQNRRHEDVDRRIVALTEDVTEAASQGIDYWMRDGDSDDVRREALVIGQQMQIQFGVALLGQDYILTNALDIQMVRFMDALTGGDFEVQNRKADPSRCRAIAMEKAEFINELRRIRRGHAGPMI